jgi:alkyl hydroperoxide reductase subunit AhpC
VVLVFDRCSEFGLFLAAFGEIAAKSLASFGGNSRHCIKPDASSGSDADQPDERPHRPGGAQVGDTPSDAAADQRSDRERAMSLRINSIAPDFTAETTQGPVSFHQWIGDGWAILFSHPKDFTPVCTTELGYMAGLMPRFAERNTKIIGLSVDPVGNHAAWAKDIEETQGHAVTYPMIGDPDLKVAKLYDMLPEETAGEASGRTAADNATVRSVFVIGPDKKIKAMLIYPMSTGRNFDEVLRLLESCQLTARHNVATPVNWRNGEDVIIPPAVSNEQAKEKFPGGWRTVKPYLRIVPQPQD